MSNLSIEVGRVVVSTAGRDKNKVFIITKIVDKEYVYIADGDLRILAVPKKKKIKHLDLKPEVLDNIKEKLMNSKKVFDAELKSAIKSLEYGEVKKGD
ncbi:MAG: KOW domain-containing RNA-binding protein [Eubacteriales bacterium]